MDASKRTMSSPKHSSKNVRNDFPNSVYIKGKPAAPQPRKATPRIIGKTPCKHCGVMNWQDVTECTHCGEPAKAARHFGDATTDELARIIDEHKAELERVKEERDGLLQLLDDHNITIGRVKQQLDETQRAYVGVIQLGAEWADKTRKAEQQRDELLEAAKAALDYASDVCPSSALPYESKLKAAISNAEKEAS